MSTRIIIEIILGILSFLGTSYFIYTKFTVRSKKKMTAKETKGIAAALNSGQVVQAHSRGQIVQNHRQFYSNGSTLIINMINPEFNLDSPVPDNLKKKLISNISKIGRKYQVPEEKIEVAEKIVDDSTGSFGDLSTAFLPVSGTFARVSQSSQREILSEILRLTDLDHYVEVYSFWKCEQCGHINYLTQATCEKCSSPRK